MSASPEDYNLFSLGDVDLQSGQVLVNAKLGYKTWGKLNSDADNVILLPTFYTGTHVRNQGFIGSHRVLNPEQFFIVSINLFGNGISTSPSNADATIAGPNFPRTTLYDKVKCRHRLLNEALGVKQIKLVTGWSMAGCQSFQWAAQYPDKVEAIIPFCGSSKTSPHNIVFLEGVKQPSRRIRITKTDVTRLHHKKASKLSLGYMRAGRIPRPFIVKACIVS